MESSKKLFSQLLLTLCCYCVITWCLPVFQGPQALCGCHLRRRGSKSRLSHGDVHLLRGLLCGFSLLLRQHLRGFDHHHLPGAGRQGHVGVQPGEEWGAALVFFSGAIASKKMQLQICWGSCGLAVFSCLGKLAATSVVVCANQRANKAGFMFSALFVFTSDACY